MTYEVGWMMRPLAVLGLAIIMFFVVFTVSTWSFYHQCDAEKNGCGDPNCLNYKKPSLLPFDDEWYSTAESREIAKRSGADLNRFDEFHREFG